MKSPNFIIIIINHSLESDIFDNIEHDSQLEKFIIDWEPQWT